jgi:4-hydroxy-tetrahydrodipicolinate reductase
MKIAIAGAGGRMGQTLLEAVLGDSELTLVAALEAPGSPAIGRSVGAARIDADLGALAGADVLVDPHRAHAPADGRAAGRHPGPHPRQRGVAPDTHQQRQPQAPPPTRASELN